MEVFRIISPIDGSVYLERPRASAEEIERTLQAAERAQTDWRRRSVSERARICRHMTEILVNQAAAIGEELAWQMGRPVAYASMEIERAFQERALFFIESAETCLADIPGAPKEGFRFFIRREPVGIVFVIAPWNYPFLTAVNAVMPALLAGNAVLLKPSEQTMLSAERLTEAFRRAGGPPEVFQHLFLAHEDVPRIIGDPRIGFVAFTGSVEGGYAIRQAVVERFIGTGLELGGKDPAYVRADADLPQAVENIVDGSFFNSGQSCCAVERVYVHESLFDRFVESAVTLTKQYVLGNPLEPTTTLGPMVRPSAAASVREQIAEARVMGAECLVASDDFPVCDETSPYLPPQILVGVDHRMKLMTEETFGPAVGIMRVKNDDEAVRLMNDSRYGLSASIWTRDVEAAERMGNRLCTGTVFMNRCDYLEPSLAWTGVGESGHGVTLSKLGFDAFTQPKSFHLRLPEKAEP